MEKEKILAIGATTIILSSVLHREDHIDLKSPTLQILSTNQIALSGRTFAVYANY